MRDDIWHAERVFRLAKGSYPFDSYFATVLGSRMHFVDQGHGPILLMVHGNPSWSYLYRHLILALRSHFRCIAIDLPGFGMSETPPGFQYLPEEHARYLAAFLEEMEIKDATLVAHDWGGPIGMAAGFAQPGRITRYILGNTWAWPLNGIWHFEWFSRLFGGFLGKFGARRFNLFVKSGFPFRAKKPFSAETRAAYLAPMKSQKRREGTHVMPKALTASREFLAGIESHLKEVQSRDIMFLWPDDDLAFRAAELRRWKTYFPQAQVVHLKDCGYYPWEESPEECAQAIREWMAQRLAGN